MNVLLDAYVCYIFLIQLTKCLNKFFIFLLTKGIYLFFFYDDTVTNPWHDPNFPISDHGQGNVCMMYVCGKGKSEEK